MTHPSRHRLFIRIALAAPLLGAWLGCAGGSTSGAGGSGAAGGSAGSGGAGGSPAGGLSANALACQAFKSGPFAPVTGRANYTFSDPGPPVQNDRKAYRVSLPSPSNVGHVSFKVPAAGEYVIFASKPLPIALYTWDGTIISPKTVTDTVSECAEVKARQSFDLGIDTKAHVIRLGPDSGGTVDLLLSAAAP
jgi:hypothetical protein